MERSDLSDTRESNDSNVFDHVEQNLTNHDLGHWQLESWHVRVWPDSPWVYPKPVLTPLLVPVLMWILFVIFIWKNRNSFIVFDTAFDTVKIISPNEQQKPQKGYVSHHKKETWNSNNLHEIYLRKLQGNQRVKYNYKINSNFVSNPRWNPNLQILAAAS